MLSLVHNDLQANTKTIHTLVLRAIAMTVQPEQGQDQALNIA